MACQNESEQEGVNGGGFVQNCVQKQSKLIETMMGTDARSNNQSAAMQNSSELAASGSAQADRQDPAVKKAVMKSFYSDVLDFAQEFKQEPVPSTRNYTTTSSKERWTDEEN